jgi:hypothetical protein
MELNINFGSWYYLLKLGYNQITGQGIKFLIFAHFPNLKKLNLSMINTIQALII